jgi:chromosome segregation ATPase
LRRNNVWKNRIVSFVIGLALGILGTAGAVLIGQSGDPGGLAELDRANQQRTAETVASLERTVGEQRERIARLQASNSRLEEHIEDARGIVEQLTVSVGTAADDIRSAIALLKTVTDQVKSLDRLLGRGDPGGDSGDGLDNIQDL